MHNQNISVYNFVGGDETFRKLVDTFYNKIESDAALRSIFPEDLEPGKKWQFLFLTQLFGGPQRYAQQRGHPRLRMRHAPYPIDQTMRDRWLQHMLEAIDEIGIAEPARSIMIEYFEHAATHMINTHDTHKSSG
ncbi:MAG: globin, partial [Phototrophicales bacterium]